MDSLTIEFRNVKPARAQEIRDAIAHVYSVEATDEGVRRALREYFIRPAMVNLRQDQAMDAIDKVVSIADFGEDLGDEPPKDSE